jgi:Flp pilus assembly protein TadG
MSLLLLKKFKENRAGNFGMLTALLLVPIAGVAGLTIDFTSALNIRAKLQGAGDAAVLAALTSTSPGMQAVYTMTTDGEVLVADADAKAVFKGQLGGMTGYTLTSLNAKVIKTGNQVTATVEFKASVPTTLATVMGWKTMSVAGHSTAEIQTQTYRDFYLLLDNTPSMGVGATTNDINKMVANTSDQCAFACHIVNNGVEDPNSYYNLAKRLGVTTRIDVVAQATAALMDTATAYRQSQNQYRMGVYTFGEKAEDQKLLEVVAPTTNLSNAKSSASKINLMSIPYQGYDNDQQTSFDTALSQLTLKMGQPGDGTSTATPQKIIYMVSDGVGDSYKPSSCTEKTTGGRCQEPIDTRVCTTLKAQGYTIAVLYTTYLPLPTNDWYNTWISPFHDDISTRMQTCASPGLFFEVSPTGGISDAMATLFKKIISSPRVTS